MNLGYSGLKLLASPTEVLPICPPDSLLEFPIAQRQIDYCFANGVQLLLLPTPCNVLSDDRTASTFLTIPAGTAITAAPVSALKFMYDLFTFKRITRALPVSCTVFVEIPSSQSDFKHRNKTPTSFDRSSVTSSLGVVSFLLPKKV